MSENELTNLINGVIDSSYDVGWYANAAERVTAPEEYKKLHKEAIAKRKYKVRELRKYVLSLITEKEKFLEVKTILLKILHDN